MTQSDEQTRADEIIVVHAPERHRYELRDGDEMIGFANYRPGRGGNQLIFDHTVVNPGYEGRGLGGRLVKFTLDEVTGAGTRIVPLCPYIAAYLRRHHDYDDWIDWPEAA
ncbi:GNAT family N-acetyltransferase [Salinibacterium sp. ZJ450]|uniref:GNAT family N-acetyltransferase n=1 Tax=Salinibacterium sp. ZJ450 TaxID=2708338 RepID=UPI00142444FC|nr:GNAT family N-acetyltransferase [Salinibacterium sp. ZJ450]